MLRRIPQGPGQDLEEVYLPVRHNDIADSKAVLGALIDEYRQLAKQYPDRVDLSLAWICEFDAQHDDQVFDRFRQRYFEERVVWANSSDAHIIALAIGEMEGAIDIIHRVQSS